MLVVSYIKRHQTIEPITRQRWREQLTVDGRSSESIHDVDLMSAQGDLATTKLYGEQLISRISGDQRIQCMIDLGQVYLDMGNHLRASSILADATTMSSLQDTPTIYLRSQTLARPSLIRAASILSYRRYARLGQTFGIT